MSSKRKSTKSSKKKSSKKKTSNEQPKVHNERKEIKEETEKRGAKRKASTDLDDFELALSSSGPTKKALQFGLNYPNVPGAELSGCINDVTNLKSNFLTKVGFSEKFIIQMTDQTNIQPTKVNMERAIKQLVEKSTNGDVLFLQYSGHGVQVEDVDSDEPDKKDEAICPLDFKKQGKIIDDWLFETIVRPLEKKKETKFWGFFDSCNSGTVMDLAWQYYAQRASKPTVKTKRSKRKDRESKAQVFNWSAALDYQLAEEAPDEIPQGAFTKSFLTVVSKHLQKPMTYRQFLLAVDQELVDSGCTHKASLSSTQEINLDSIFDFWSSPVKDKPKKKKKAKKKASKKKKAKN